MFDFGLQFVILGLIHKCGLHVSQMYKRGPWDWFGWFGAVGVWFFLGSMFCGVWANVINLLCGGLGMGLVWLVWCSLGLVFPWINGLWGVGQMS